MSASDSLIELLKEALAPLGTVTVRRMFGGAGIYAGGVMFGLIDGDVVYFKADAGSKTRYEAEGLGRFVYNGKTKPVAMSYWRIPERLYDEPEEMLEWARTALKVARTSATATKPAKQKSRAKKPSRRPHGV